MITPGANQGSQPAYDLWLGLISQVFGLLGAQPGAASANTAGDGVPEGLRFPIDQVAKAADMTRHWLNNLTPLLTPLLQAGNAANLLTQWAAAMPGFGPGKAADSAASMTEAMLAPWSAFIAGAMPAASSLSPAAMVTAQDPMQTLNRTWVKMASQFTGSTPAQFDATFERVFGALSDGLGLGPSRKLQAAWRDVFAANLAQQDARAHYAALIQGIVMQGYQHLLHTLAAKAEAGERIDSVFTLIRLWVSNTERAAHETLQSEQGLASTTALLRADLAYRNKMRQATAVLADQVDVATRQDLDDAYREIQALKRELRMSRNVASVAPVTQTDAPPRKAASAKTRPSRGAAPKKQRASD